MSDLYSSLIQLHLSEAEYRPLSSLAKIETGNLNANAAESDGDYAFFTCSEAVSRTDTYRWDSEAILVSGNGYLGVTHHYEGKFNAYQRTYVVTDFQGVLPKFVHHYMQAKFRDHALSNAKQGSVPYIVLSTLADFQVPIPSISVQLEIIRILDTFSMLEAELEAELEARSKQFEFFSQLYFDPDSVAGRSVWSVRDLCLSISAGGDVPPGTLKGQNQPTAERPNPVYSNGVGDSALYGYSSTFKIDSEAITISARGTIGFPTLRGGRFTPIVRLITLIPDTAKADASWLRFALGAANFSHDSGGIPQLTVPTVSRKQILVPNLERQRAEANSLEVIQQLKDAIQTELQLRRKQLEFYRDLLLNFREPKE